MAVIKSLINMPLARGVVSVLFALSILLPLGEREARGEDYAIAQSYVHLFSNNLAVFSEVFALNKEVSLDTSAYVKYTVDFVEPGLFEDDDDDDGDAVSGASSAAGGRDIRHELTAGVSHNFEDLVGVDLYYDVSWEKDYASTTPTVTLKKELYNKNTTLSFGYSRNMDEISGKYIGGTEERTTNNYYFGLTQVLSPFTIMQAGYSRMRSSGFMPEGIRLVPVDGATAASCTAESATCLDEVFPESRKRNAFILGVNHYFNNVGTGKRFNIRKPSLEMLTGLFNRSVLRLTVRYYYDDWDIDSFTAEVVQSIPIFERNTLRLNYRFYIQDEASFFKENYLSSDPLRTTSPQHRAFNTQLFGAKLSRKLKRSPQAGSFGLGTIEGKYEFYLESSEESAHIVMASFRFVY